MTTGPTTRATRPAPRAGSGVIHDIGYRGFDGRRVSLAAIMRELFTVSLLHTFGIRRSARSKIVPWLFTALMLIPAIVLAGSIAALSRVPAGELASEIDTFSNYWGYPYWTQLLVTIFVAAQAPVLFARDLRYRSIVLYFARPLPRVHFVLVRMAALATAIVAIIAVPMTIWLLAAVSTSLLDTSTSLRNYGAALVGVVILAVILAAASGLLAALTTRSGLAIAAIIVALMIASAVVTVVQAAALANERPSLALVAGAFSPFTAVGGLVSGAFDQSSPMLVWPQSAGWVAYYGAACAVWVVTPTLALLARMTRAASL